MKSLQLINVSKSYGGEKILSNINLTVPLGTFFALLGPSGSGKTTLLRLIAGLETVDEGKILLNGIDITHLPIHLRTINTVFQHYALFPHMNVFDNVAYGLRIKNISSSIIQETVKNILHIVHLTKYMHKEIHQLSGGQQQRVALARAIVNAPTILLLDEPLAALDLKLREQMLLELIELQDRLKITFIYVTHDQDEALTVADLMAIMNRKGDIEQVGTPKDTYENPKTSFVAKFVGTTNIFYGTLINTAQKQTVDIPQLGIFEVTLPANVVWVDSHQQIIMSIRPEKIDISKVPLVGFSNHIQGVVHAIVYHGRSTQYNVLLNNGMIVSVFEQNEEHFPKEVIDYDDLVHLYWQKENVILLEH